MTTHRIKLRGPWKYAALTTASEATEATGRITLPADLASFFQGFSGLVRFQRSFHQPANLDPHERVFLVISQLCSDAVVRCNDRILNSETTGEYEVTELLKPFNEVAIDLPISGQFAESCFHAVLEIRSR